MIYSSANAKTILENNTNISTKIGCTFEYNMNTLVDNITVTGTDIVAANGSKPFKKLFPADAIIKSNRPVGAGIKYAITGDVTTNSYRNPKSIAYPMTFRTYYPGIDTTYKYYLTAKSTAADVTLSYPKTILTNKIIARFELSHSTPSTWTIYGNGTQLATGSITETFATLPAKNYNAGTVTIHYNGTSWTTTEPSIPSAPVSLTSIRLTASAVADKYIGIIEFSPRWVVDVSDRISLLGISKESSTSADDILPIGKVSANSLSLGLISYEDSRTVQSFDKTFTFDSSKIYLYKQIQIKPYIKLYFTGAALTDSNGQYEKFNQGVFYCDSWSTGEYGDIDITALDSAKLLQDTLCPSLICEEYSVPGILRRLLDSIGFTNYNINTATAESSPLSPKFWWSDDSKTVWQAVQELCRDAQITAVVDENNILQFYTRDYLFNTSRASDWSFRLNANGSALSNIISLNKTDLASANQIKILWNSVTTNEYAGQAQPLWQGGKGWMAALSLDQNLYTSDLAGSYIKLTSITTNDYEAGKVIDEYSGYLVIDAEIIEYDGIEYFYKTSEGATVNVIVENDSDVLKFLGLGAVGSDKTGRTGRVRIKTRGAFGTTIANHYAAAQDIINSWSGFEVSWV